MGRKAKYSKQQKVQACEDYLNGTKSARQIAKELNMGKRGSVLVTSWVHSYKINGHTIFDNKNTNNRYSKEFKNHVARIKEIASSNHSLFGTVTMYYTLKHEGYSCGHNRVYRLMCIHDIKSAYRRKAGYDYIRSVPEQTAENILSRDFNTSGPNKKWCTDVTEIKVPATGEKLYISSMIDLYDRFPVTLEVSARNDAYLANLTLYNAHKAYPDATPLVDSDRGIGYTRAGYKSKLIEYGMTQSMSRVSKCIDNGVCEGFQGQFCSS